MMTGHSDLSPGAAQEADPAAAPTDQELLTGKGSIAARLAEPDKPQQSEKADRTLDRELDQSMDASDPPASIQP